MHYGCRLVWNRDGTLFVTQGDRSITPAACRRSRWTAASARSSGSMRTALSRKTIRSSARKACGLRSGRTATATSRRRRCIRRPASCGKSSTARAAATRSNLAQGQGLRLADHRLRDRIPGRADHRRHHREGRHGAADLLLGSGDRAERHVLLHRQPVSRSGGTASSSAALVTTNIVRLDVQGEKIVGEERLLKDLQPKPERIRDVEQGPDGAIYAITDSPTGTDSEAGPEEIDRPGRAAENCLVDGRATGARCAQEVRDGNPARAQRGPLSPWRGDAARRAITDHDRGDRRDASSTPAARCCRAWRSRSATSRPTSCAS